MKKIILTIASLFVMSLSIIAQIKEGTITYDMKMEGLPPEQAAMMGDMETKMSFKNGKVFSETTSMMFNNQTLIDETGMTMLMDQMGNKMAIKQTKEELEKSSAKGKDNVEPKIEYTTETKTIVGYDCKKAIITIIGKDKKEEKMEMWYCDKFENPNKEGKGKGLNMMKGLNGLPFEYVISQGPMKFKMVAKSINTDPIPDSKFTLSTDGYKVMSMDDLKNLQGGK